MSLSPCWRTPWLGLMLGCRPDKPVEPAGTVEDSAVPVAVGSVLDSATTTDRDGDGWEECSEETEGRPVPRCDCDDDDPTRNPGADEVCDGTDNDCDDKVDDHAVDAETWFDDADGDGYGDDPGETGCGRPADAVDQGGDCDDRDAAVNPSAVEVCNDIDDNCSGRADDGAVCALVDDCPLDVLVAFEHPDGSLTDLTADFEASRLDAPLRLSLSEAGTLKVCKGTWYLKLTVDAPDVQIVGLEGAEVTALVSASDDEDRATLLVTEAGSGLKLQGLTFKGEWIGVEFEGAPGATLVDTRFTDFVAALAGDNGTLLIQDSLFDSNLGGIDLNGSGATTIEDSVFTKNDLTLFQRGDGELIVSASRFEENGTSYGRGACTLCSNGDLFVTDTDFLLNELGNTSSAGGAIRGWADIDVQGCLFEHNLSGGEDYAQAGAIYSEGDLRVQDSIFTGNRAVAGWGGGEGGAIYARYGSVSLNNVVITDSTAGGYGGAINLYEAALEVTDSEISENEALYSGGGVYMIPGELSSVGSLWADNLPEDLYVYGSGSVTIGTDDVSVP